MIDRPPQADTALNTVWRNASDGRAVLLYITAAGVAAIGVEPESACPTPSTRAPTPPASRPAGAPAGADQAPAEVSREARGRPRKTAPTGRTSRLRRRPASDTKQAQLIAMLRRKEGATIAQIVAATGWQPHTVRGAFAGALKKKLGLESPPRRSRASGSTDCRRLNRPFGTSRRSQGRRFSVGGLLSAPSNLLMLGST